MAKGLTLDIAANTRDFQKGTKDVEGALEDVSDALDDAAKDGDKSAEKLERSFSEAQREISNSSKRGADDLARNTQQGANKASGELRELGNEARQNAAETFSSFDGSAESFADGIQGTLGGIVSSLGPIGAAAGAAGALGIGLIMNALTQAGEDTEELKAKVADLASELIDSGIIGKRTFEDMVTNVKDLATETDDSKRNLSDLRDIAKTLKVPFEDVVNAYTAGGDGLQDLIDKTEDLKKKEQERFAAATEAGASPYAGAISGGIEYEQKLNGITDTLTKQRGAIDSAIEAQELYLASGVTEMELKAGLIGAVNDAYDDAAGSATDYIDEESKLFDTAAYIKAMQQREKALDDYQQTLASAELSPEAKSFLNEQGVDAAASFLQGYKNASPAQQAELNRIWSEAGRENSGTYSGELESQFASTEVKGPKIAPEMPDGSAMRQQLQRDLNRGGPLTVDVVATRNGQRVY